jgi:hypothetical protein
MNNVCTLDLVKHVKTRKFCVFIFMYICLSIAAVWHLFEIVAFRLSFSFPLSSDRTQIKTHNSRRRFFRVTYCLIHIFLCWIKISTILRGREKETKRRRQEEVKIKCVISFRHQSASNRRDLELNSLLPTRYTTLFTTIITYKYI